jgi:uncharacterized membrane protein SirB2
MKTHTLVCGIPTMVIVCMCVYEKEEEKKLWLGKKAILTIVEYKIETTQTIRKERNDSRQKKIYLTFNS